MAISLEQYVAEATKAYQPAKDAVQAQLDAIPGQLQAANETINRNYARQQTQLNDQRNAAATAASIQAAGSGGSFGGAANLANRRYYTQSFVPAQSQLQTNQSNELQSTRRSYEDKRTNLNSQLASIDAQANEMALQKYWEAVEAEKQRQAQLQAARMSAAASSNPLRYLPDGYGSDSGVKTWNFGNGYKVYDDNGEAIYSLNGNQITRGQFLEGTSKNTNWDLWNDIWNSGTKTNGIGSDTIQAYKDFYRVTAPKATGATISLNKSSKYGYLY